MEQNWYVERRKRITASKAGAISKMRKGTKRANKVKELLYTKFRGNKHTSYGTANEEASRQAYVAWAVAALTTYPQSGCQCL